MFFSDFARILHSRKTLIMTTDYIFQCFTKIVAQQVQFANISVY